MFLGGGGRMYLGEVEEELSDSVVEEFLELVAGPGNAVGEGDVAGLVQSDNLVHCGQPLLLDGGSVQLRDALQEVVCGEKVVGVLKGIVEESLELVSGPL